MEDMTNGFLGTGDKSYSKIKSILIAAVFAAVSSSKRNEDVITVYDKSG